MSLTNPRFASNQRLQRAARNAPPMRRGERDRAAVAILQRGLVDYGFPMPRSTRPDGSMDGGFGSETVDAVKWFQRKNGLLNRSGNGDGIVGEKTMTKMDEVVPPTTPRPLSGGTASYAPGPGAEGPTSPSGRDNRIYDAINLFKYSNVGRGVAYIAGDAAHRARYQRLARDVLSELWRLWSANEIAFAHLDGAVGNSARRPGPDILVNDQIEPSTDPPKYATALDQGKLAATSGNIVHEATHLINGLCYLEEEVLCETIQVYYFRELRVGLTNNSRVTGTRHLAMYRPNVPFYSMYNDTRDGLLAINRLVDHVFSYRTQREQYLEDEDTAAFIARGLGWWGGLTNRWWSTRGHFLRSLSAQNRDYAEPILQILESIPNAHRWSQVRRHVGGIERVRRGLRLSQHGGTATRIGGHLSYNSAFANRVRRVQAALGESFGV